MNTTATSPENNSTHSIERRVAIFDLDRTITRIGTFTPFLLSTRQSILARAWLLMRLPPHLISYLLGRIDRVELKNRMMVIAFSNHDRKSIEGHAQKFVIKTIAAGLYKKAVEAVDHHGAEGDFLILATASVDFYAKLFAEKLGFDATIATETEFRDDLYGPPVIPGENCYGDAKRRMVMSELDGLLDVERDKLHLSFYSDHHSDWALLEVVDAPFAVNPTRKLKAIARQHKVPILDWAD